MTMPRMRTAEKVLDIIKETDPGTEVTLYHLRRIIRTEAVPVVTCGRKRLVNVDDVLALLAGGYKLPGEPKAEPRIRRVV